MNDIQQSLWREALEARRRALTQKRYAGIFAVLDNASFTQVLPQIVNRYSGRKTMKIMSVIRPVVAQLESFTEAVSILVSSHPAVAALIWGSFQILLQMASRFSKTFDKIVKMVQDLLETMPHFVEYMTLFPAEPKLSDLLRVLYERYIDFCTYVIDFLHKKPICNLLRFLFVPIEEEFDRSKEDITAQKDRFERQIQLLRTQAIVNTNRRTRQIQGVLPQISLVSQSIRSQPIFEVPFTRNNRFVGREVVLSNIHQSLTSLDPIGLSWQTSCILHGVGGVGKTQVALEYTYRYKPHYQSVFWFAAEFGPSLEVSFGEAAKQLGLFTAENASELGTRIELVKNWLRTNSAWLLVFDNVENADVLKNVWPAGSNGSILVTSQNPELAQRTTSDINLPSFDAIEGRQLLYTYLRDSTLAHDDIAAEELSEEVGGLPMAIAHISSYIYQAQSDLSSFLATFRRRQSAALIWESGSTVSTYQSAKTLEIVFDIAINNITEDARKLLYILTFLNPDRVDEDMLVIADQNIEFQFLGRPGDFVFNNLVRSLRGWHLVERISDASSKYLKIHRSVKKSILHKLDKIPQTRQEVFKKTLYLLRRQVPRQSEIEIPEQHKWPIHEKYLAHVSSLHAIFVDALTMTPPISPSLELAELFSDVGRYLYDRGTSEDAIQFLQLAEKMYATLDPHKQSSIHAKTLASLATLFAFRGFSGRENAVEYGLRAHDIKLNLLSTTSQVSTIDQLLLSNSWEDQASDNLDGEDFDKAEVFIEKSLEIKRRCGTETEYPYEYAVSCSDLSYVRVSQGRHDEAIELLHRGQALLALQPGPNSGFIERYEFIKACHYFSSGDIDKSFRTAKQLHERLIERDVPSTHTNLLNTRYLLGTIHHEKRELGQAEEMFRFVLEGQHSAGWPEECISRAQYRLSLVLEELGEYDAANDARIESMESQTKLLQRCSLPVSRPKADKMGVFDYMVSVYYGRTSGPFRPLS